MEILLTFHNSDRPFVTKEDGEYFIFRHKNFDAKDKYVDDPAILLDAIQHVKPVDYHKMHSLERAAMTKAEYWECAFNYMYSGGGLVLWQNPTEYWNSELCRRGQLPCKKCGRATKMYYTPTCFYCERPKPDQKGRYYLIPVCYYVALKNNLPLNEIKDTILDYDVFEYHNDTILDLYYTENEKVDKYIRMIDEEFPIATTNFFVSW